MIVAFVALMVTLFGTTVELKSIKITREIQNWLGHESEAAAIRAEEQPTIIDQLHEYLSEPNEAGTATRLEEIGSTIGQRLFQANRFSEMQKLSVDSKVQNKMDNMVEAAVKKKMPTQLKVLQGILDYLEIPVNALDLAREGKAGNMAASLAKFGVNPAEQRPSGKW